MSCIETPLRCGGSYASCTSMNRVDRRPLEFLETSYKSLSSEERARLNRDLYGSEQPISESPSFIDDKLDELEKEIGRLSKDTKKAYTQALAAELENALKSTNHRNSDEKAEVDEHRFEYASSRKFRLMFLRSERFNTQMAARRLVRYYKEKLDLFGREKLIHTINQRDLDTRDIEALRSGAVVFPGVTDSAGRLIVLNRRCRFGELKLVNMKRMIFYLYMTAIRGNEDHQRKGVVMIACNVGFKVTPAYTNRRKEIFSVLRAGYRALPVRVACVHMCYNNAKEHIFINIMLVVIPNEVRARLQCHYGEHEAIIFDLLKYGINVDALPLTSDGDIINSLVIHNLEQRRLQEEREEDSISSGGEES